MLKAGYYHGRTSDKVTEAQKEIRRESNRLLSLAMLAIVSFLVVTTLMLIVYGAHVGNLTLRAVGAG